jgi:hypothetical protein
MLVTLFNDLDHENVASLQAAIEAMPEVKKLKHLRSEHLKRGGWSRGE